MVYTGTFERNLDAKGRVLLPKKLRASVPKSETLYLTPGTDGCLELHTLPSLEQLASEAGNANSKTVRSFSRLFYAQAEQLEVDSQGRIRIPRRLKDWSNLDKDVVIVGVGANWEIWDATTWKEYFSSQSGNFDWVHQSTFDPETEPADKDSAPLPTTPK